MQHAQMRLCRSNRLAGHLRRASADKQKNKSKLQEIQDF